VTDNKTPGLWQQRYTVTTELPVNKKRYQNWNIERRVKLVRYSVLQGCVFTVMALAYSENLEFAVSASIEKSNLYDAGLLINLMESVQWAFTKRVRAISKLSYTGRFRVFNLEPLELHRLRYDLVQCYKIPNNPTPLNPVALSTNIRQRSCANHC
jgi:hypothetical protein